MNRLLFISIFLFTVMQPAFSGTGIYTNSPAIKFTELNYDFGKVEQGVTLEHTFSFTNEGDTKLIIQSVHPSCGCTGATIIGDKKEFGQGETGEIKITFNTQGRTGVNSKMVTVTTNDPSNSQITLSFTCEITVNK